MTNWCLNRQDSLWVELESLASHPRQLNSLLFINNIDQLKPLKNNSIVFNTLLVWRDIRRYLKIPSILSVWLPLSLDPDFPHQIRAIGLSEWSSKGLSDFTALLISASFKTFEQIKNDFDISHKDFFRHLQIRHFTLSLLQNDSIRLKWSELKSVVVSSKSLKGIISKFYTLLLQSDSSAFGSLRLLWERDLGVTFSNDD